MRPRVLLDFSQPQGPNGERLRLAFGDPSQCLIARDPTEVRGVVDAVQAHAAAGAWCVGYLRYEAAPAFDSALCVHAADGPLAWFGVFHQPMPWPQSLPAENATVHWAGDWSLDQFEADIRQIHAAIARGDLYQVNHTAPLHGRLDGDALALFRALSRAQPAGYSAYIDADEEQILSVSPELFFDWRDGVVLTRPMKGTAARGATPEQDARQAEALLNSPKERAENVMIVDLLRNDLSRLAQGHSVRVPRLFQVQALPTLWQMTSDVTARARPGTTLADVFAALFPCGSVTGAPKVQSMRVIHDMEARPRGVYCGAVGVVMPEGAATFNVPIRTAVVRGHQVTCGIGSGVTADATAAGEWAEWQGKRAFVERAREPFELLETLALQDGEYRHGQDHLERLTTSAAHFGFDWNPQQARDELTRLARMHPQGLWRVRLLLSAEGQVSAQALVLDPRTGPVRLALATRPFGMAHSEFTRFKTTRRAHYDAFAPTGGQVFDTILWNTRGELTECTRGNLAIRVEGRWLTPAAPCGLLPGVARARALREGWLQEAVLTRDDLSRASAMRFGNSLRGWLDAQVVEP